MPERVMAVLERHPGEVLTTAAIADEAGANEAAVYQAPRRIVLKRREGVTQAGAGRWRHERAAEDARLRVVGEGE